MTTRKNSVSAAVTIDGRVGHEDRERHARHDPFHGREGTVLRHQDEEEDAGEDEHGSQVEAHAQRQQVEHEIDERGGPRRLGKVAPLDDEPRHETHERVAHAVDFGLDRVGPVGVAEGEEHRADERAADAHQAVGRGLALAGHVVEEANAQRVHEQHTGGTAKGGQEVHALRDGQERDREQDSRPWPPECRAACPVNAGCRGCTPTR